MKKKIAGVLTTVLAASLLVGGNHPVTVQVDNMISGTQDDEDTQSDEAEAEAAEAEEEQSEEAKVAADPEDQPVATETPKEEKRQKKKHRKGKQPRTAPTVLPQTKKHFSKKPKN
jgi:hypothetical protein